MTQGGPRESGGRLSPVLALLALRVMLLAALPYEALTAYGDYRHFYDLARFAADGGGGLPWIGHWVEFPPVFPYLSLFIYKLCGGIEHAYAYLLAVVMLAFDAGNVLLIGRIARRLVTPTEAARVAWIYAAFLGFPAFGWWTFEPMSVFWMLLAAALILEGKAIGAGIAAGLGALTKVIPALALVVAWRARPRREAWLATALALIVSVGGLAPFVIARPEMASASLGSQVAKGSWETVWALLDGNLGTGSFGPIEEHLDPAQALRPRGNPPRIPPWIPTLAFGAFGFWCTLRTPGRDDRLAIRLLAVVWVLLFLCSRGWSPQWLAYLVPVVLLSLPPRRAVGLGLALASVSLLEWPLLLSRGRFDLLWLPVLLRTGLLVLAAVVLVGQTIRSEAASEGGP